MEIEKTKQDLVNICKETLGDGFEFEVSCSERKSDCGSSRISRDELTEVEPKLFIQTKLLDHWRSGGGLFLGEREPSEYDDIDNVKDITIRAPEKVMNKIVEFINKINSGGVLENE